MSGTRDITLGGRTFAVPMLPLRISRLAYPLCVQLTKAQLFERAVQFGGVLDVTKDEMAQLSELAFLACQAADPTLKPDDFDNLPATPAEMLDAFYFIRFQTGGWRPIEPGEKPAGEGEGVADPPTSTSTESTGS